MSKAEGRNQFNLSTYKSLEIQEMGRSYLFLALAEVAWPGSNLDPDFPASRIMKWDIFVVYKIQFVVISYRSSSKLIQPSIPIININGYTNKYF